MNKVNLIGNLAADPELRYSTGENPMAICKFRIAVSEGFGDKQKTSFIPVIVFGKTAENCDKFLAKGSKVAVSGKIQTGSYEGKNGKVYTTDVIADNYGGIEFLSNGNNNSNDNSYGNAEKTPQNESQEQIEGFSALTDDESIPF